MVTMRAIQIPRLDGPRTAELVEIDEPEAGDGVLIDVHAAGVAFPDALQTRGLYQHRPELPYVPGPSSPASCAAPRRVPTSWPVTGSPR